MKRLNIAWFMVLSAILVISCNAQSSENSESTNFQSESIQVYYFHFTKRCVTCNAVESETKASLESFYADNVKKGEIEFTSLNLDEPDAKEIAKALKVSGQTLLIVKGDEQVNLTNEGFMNARTNPDKFHDIFKKQMDKFL